MQEAAIREELRVARDKEIETAIARLEEASAQEATAAEEQVGGAFRLALASPGLYFATPPSRYSLKRHFVPTQMKQRIRRIQEKCDTQLRDAEKAERASLAKYAKAKEQLAEVTAELATVKGQLAQLERDAADAHAVSSRLQRERDRMSDVIRLEFAERLAELEKEVESSRHQLREEKTARRDELQALEARKEAEVDELHAKVKRALEKKDETVRSLRDQLQAANTRADHFEQLLTRQREALLEAQGDK